MRKFLISAFMALTGFVNAQSVTLDEASRIASLFFEEKNLTFQKCAGVAVSGNDTLYYIMNADHAFVVVPGNKNYVPVLAYVPGHSYEAGNLIPPVAMWLEHYRNQIASERAVENREMSEYWEKLLNGRASFRSAQRVEPLLTSAWGQDDYYNFYCPKDLNGPNGRAVTGCVATAMAQLLYYFRYPESGIGEYQYTHPVYGQLSANFGEAVYDYDAMCDKPSGINPAISMLNTHLGVAVDMEYGAAASGMTNHKAAYIMRTYFKYPRETEYIYRDSVTLDWDSLIVDHLERRIPLYYAGWSVPHTDGHAFICDGFEKDGESNYYYHFNFGWSGYYDGYFYTRPLNPGGNNFNLAQELVVNAYPDSASYTYPFVLVNGSKSLTSAAGSFEYGVTRVNRDPVDHTWFVAPDVENLDSVYFSVSYMIGENDTLFILSDDPDMPGYIITNNSALLTGYAKGSEISFRFKGETGTNSRIYGNYRSMYRIFCQSRELFTASSGIIEDGSGPLKYNNCARCITYIRTADARIDLRMEEFDTEEGEDVLYIYHAGRTPVLLASLSGNLTDSTYTFWTDRLNLIFETSEKNAHQGWRLHYTSGVAAATSEHETDLNITVLPNPVLDYMDIHIREDHAGLGSDHGFRYTLYDLSGRKLTENEVSGAQTRIDMNRYSAGIYFIHISQREGAARVFKVVKK